MKSQTLLVSFLVYLLFLVSSCGNQKKVVYFQAKSSTNISTDSIPNNYYSPIYQANDLLSITVSASDIATAQPFNFASNHVGTKNGNESESQSQLGYLIDLEGNIDFPVLGKLHLGGLNRNQAIELIKGKLKGFIDQPGVNIQILNFKVTVIGDVLRPGTFQVKDERISLLEALGLAEDMNITGVRSNVLIIREENGKKIEIRVDLTSNEFLNSRYYYLKQNDVVYIQPNKTKSNSELFGRNTSTLLSFASLLFTTLIFLFK